MGGMQPPAYTPATDFSDEERDNVGGRSTVRTAALDAELSAIATTANALRDNLYLIQRDDGNLRDQVVKLFTLAPDVLNLLVVQGDATPRGAWVTGTLYNIKDLITFGASTYIAAVTHTSGVFATDLAANKWLLLANNAPIASNVPFTPTATIASTNVQAAINEADTENRALSVLAQANAIASVLATLALSSGGTLIGFLDPVTGALATNVAAMLQQLRSVATWGATGNGTDQTTAIRAAITNSSYVLFGPGSYLLSDDLPLNNDQKIIAHPAATITQTGVNKSIFKATSKTRLTFHLNGAMLSGEGTWSAGWTGSSGHEDRAIHLIGCSDVTVNGARIKNCGLAGIALIGGDHIRINNPVIEGTHTYSTALPAAANFQFGIYAKNDPTYGALNDCIVTSPDISGVAIGILDEHEVGAAQRTDAMVVTGANIHDIPGQHGLYLTSSRFNLIGCSLTDINLAGVKIQAGDANQDIVGVSAIGIQANNLGSQMFEVAVPTPYTGRIRGTRLQGVGTNVQRGISISRRVDNLVADIVVDTCTGVGINIQDDDNHDIEIKALIRNAGLDGAIITATNSDGIKLRPTIRNPNTTTTAGACGIRVASASAQVELYDPDVTDASTKMVYGLFNSTLGSDVKVIGRARFTGASDTAVRATGVISEFPIDYVLSGTNGAFTDTSLIRSIKPMTFTLTQGSGVNTVLWQRNMADLSSLYVKVDLVSSRGGGIDRAAYSFAGLFYRFSGIATLQGAITTTVSIASGGFAATYSLQSNGANDVVLLVNNVGAVTTKWTAQVTALATT